MTSPASVRGFNLKNHEELKKNSQLIEKWHRFSLGVCEKSHPPGTDRVNPVNLIRNDPQQGTCPQAIVLQIFGCELGE